MDGLMALDNLIAGRGGDGLHPRLRALLEERRRIEADPGVVALDRHRDGPRQAGPHPVAGTNLAPERREGVLAFPEKSSRISTGGPPKNKPQQVKGRTSCTSP